MNTVAALQNFEVKSTLGKVTLSALTPEQFKNRPEIVEKYFRNDNRYLDRFHIPVMTAEEYAEIIRTMQNVSDRNSKLETATPYFIRKVAGVGVAKDLCISERSIDWTGYTFDERYYKMSNFWDNQDYVEDSWRNSGARASKNAWVSYISEDIHASTLPVELYDELFRFCIAAIRKRTAMQYCKVEQCVNMLISINKSTSGLSVNPNAQQVSNMRSYKQYFLAIAKDPEAIKFMKAHKDYELFDDYVYTYNKMLRALASHEDSIGYMLQCVRNDSDPFQKQLLEGTGEVCIDESSYVLIDNAE